MPLYARESLETLRQRIDLLEVLSPYVELKPSGATYKGLCPFHDEKTPSFVVQRGDSHYHCFGCGAHGDAIQFMMDHLSLNFGEAVESLAERFGVYLVQIEGQEQKGPKKSKLRECLQYALRFYHFSLLHTQEGHQALEYLYARGLTLDFIRNFQIGLAPGERGVFRKVMQEQGYYQEVLQAAGLLTSSGKGDFFYDRITFPIHDAMGMVIGFSARKYREETFGGKYVNTPETVLFKKSRVLFGFHHSRRRIAKEKRALIVEGQVDALCLIDKGFNWTVAGQGTAFGEGHAKQLLDLGVQQAVLALDADHAGQEAAVKIGNLFQSEGVEVLVVEMPEGKDPDTVLSEEGVEAFEQLIEEAQDYLSFLVSYHSKSLNTSTPAGKNQLVYTIAGQVRKWENPVMVHESLRKLAQLVGVPESTIGVGYGVGPNVYLQRTASVGRESVDPDRILESELIRWLLKAGVENYSLIDLAKENLKEEDLQVAELREIYRATIDTANEQEKLDLLAVAARLEEQQSQQALTEILERKINPERAEKQFPMTIQKILDRNWMQRREEINMKLSEGQCSEEEQMTLVKEFGVLNNNRPRLKYE